MATVSLTDIIARANAYPARASRFSKRSAKLAESTKAYVDAAVAVNAAAILDVPNSSVKYLAAAADDFALASGDGYGLVIVNDEIAVTMPVLEEGRVIRFLQVAVAALTVVQNADGANIAGADATYAALDAAGDTATFYCDGTEWILVESSIAS